jgi:hypothetical protein
MGNSPNWSYKYVPTTAEWNFWFSQKQDDLGLSLQTRILLQAGLNTANGIATLDGNGKIPFAQLPIVKGTFTLAANETTTTVIVTGTDFTSTAFWSPITENAAAQMSLLRGSCAMNSLNLTHGDNPNTDQTFSYFVVL